jgi:hypothetical protein
MQPKTVSYASNMILEDHLKQVLNKSNPGAKKGNALLPRAQHSAFGDFPTTHLNKSKGQDMEPKPIGAAEQSVAAAKNAMRKYPFFRSAPQQGCLASAGSRRLLREPFADRVKSIRPLFETAISVIFKSAAGSL